VLLVPVLPLRAQQPELYYVQAAFDNDTCCWRKLSAEGKYREAATLVEAYLKQHPKGLNRMSLNWHAGQLFAMANENTQALRHFHKTYKGIYKWFGGEDGRTWYYYASGTVAFLQRNKRRLGRYLRRWEKHYGTTDINYKALLRLYEHWEKPYREAA
jgi:hypothetical protein